MGNKDKTQTISHSNACIKNLWDAPTFSIIIYDWTLKTTWGKIGSRLPTSIPHVQVSHHRSFQVAKA